MSTKSRSIITILFYKLCRPTILDSKFIIPFFNSSNSLKLLIFLSFSLETFGHKHHEAAVRSDIEYNYGELIIPVPPEAAFLIAEGEALRIGIEFSLQEPKDGLHFVVPEGEGSFVEVCIQVNSYNT